MTYDITSRDKAVLTVGLEQAYSVPGFTTLVVFLGDDEHFTALHAQPTPSPPLSLDWSRIVVPPEAGWAMALTSTPEPACLVVRRDGLRSWVIGDRHGMIEDFGFDTEDPIVAAIFGNFANVWAAL
jgi:hypothetical protein